MVDTIDQRLIISDNSQTYNWLFKRNVLAFPDLTSLNDNLLHSFNIEFHGFINEVLIKLGKLEEVH